MPDSNDWLPLLLLIGIGFIATGFCIKHFDARLDKLEAQQAASQEAKQ